MNFREAIHNFVTLPKNFNQFLIVAFSSEVVYIINSLKTVLYSPFIETLHITNTQLGLAFSGMGLVAMLAYIPASWITDHFSADNIIIVSLTFVGLSGWYLSFAPHFYIVMIILISWGAFQDGPFWASVLKNVRCLAPEDKQGSAFGFLEFIRGGSEFIFNSFAIFLYTLLGSTLFGMSVVIKVNASLMLLMAFIVWIAKPRASRGESSTDEAQQGKRDIFAGLKYNLCRSECYLVGVCACGIYTGFVGTLWFFPFLQKVFAIPETYAAFFLLFNSAIIRVISSPFGGLLADYKFGSSANFLRFSTLVMALLLIVVVVIPKYPAIAPIAMLLLILVSIFTFMSRSVYFAPIGEMGIPQQYSGAAIAIAAMIGYSPSFWFNPIIGYLLDHYPTVIAYNIIYLVIMSFSLISSGCALVMHGRIRRRKSMSLSIV